MKSQYTHSEERRRWRCSTCCSRSHNDKLPWWQSTSILILIHIHLIYHSFIVSPRSSLTSLALRWLHHHFSPPLWATKVAKQIHHSHPSNYPSCKSSFTSYRPVPLSKTRPIQSVDSACSCSFVAAVCCTMPLALARIASTF
jgi:hypothetical protein